MTKILAQPAVRESIARHDSYAEAQRCVDVLSDERFPVRAVRIVGMDLRMIEQVHGRVDWARAALLAAAGGGWFGLLVGLLLGLFATGGSGTVALLFWGLVFGAVFGAVLGVGAHALTGGRRDFASRSAIVPQHYEVLVEREHAERAREVLAARQESQG